MIEWSPPHNQMVRSHFGVTFAVVSTYNIQNSLEVTVLVFVLLFCHWSSCMLGSVRIWFLQLSHQMEQMAEHAKEHIKESKLEVTVLVFCCVIGAFVCLDHFKYEFYRCLIRCNRLQSMQKNTSNKRWQILCCSLNLSLMCLMILCHRCLVI